jgi:hypothetical protein
MTQGVLPFKYEEEKSKSGMTALAGLPIYLDLARVLGLSASIQKHVKIRENKSGLDRLTGVNVIDSVESGGRDQC